MKIAQIGGEPHLTVVPVGDGFIEKINAIYPENAPDLVLTSEPCVAMRADYDLMLATGKRMRLHPEISVDSSNVGTTQLGFRLSCIALEQLGFEFPDNPMSTVRFRLPIVPLRSVNDIGFVNLRANELTHAVRFGSDRPDDDRPPAEVEVVGIRNSSKRV